MEALPVPWPYLCLPGSGWRSLHSTSLSFSSESEDEESTRLGAMRREPLDPGPAQGKPPRLAPVRPGTPARMWALPCTCEIRLRHSSHALLSTQGQRFQEPGRGRHRGAGAACGRAHRPAETSSQSVLPRRRRPGAVPQPRHPPGAALSCLTGEGTPHGACSEEGSRAVRGEPGGPTLRLLGIARNHSPCRHRAVRKSLPAAPAGAEPGPLPARAAGSGPPLARAGQWHRPPPVLGTALTLYQPTVRAPPAPP